MTTKELERLVRKNYDDARREGSKLFDDYVCGDVGAERWRYDDARLQGMREAYAIVLDMLER